MADTLKVLGQAAPSATTETTLYTAPSAATISTIVVCNRSTAATFRVSVAIAGAVTANQQYLYYNQDIGANTTFTITIGITLANTDVVRVYASTANLSFSAFGVEVA